MKFFSLFLIPIVSNMVSMFITYILNTRYSILQSIVLRRTNIAIFTIYSIEYRLKKIKNRIIPKFISAQAFYSKGKKSVLKELS